MESAQYVFCYGSNHPEQLSRRIGVPIADLLKNAVACFLEGWKRVYVGVSRNWGGRSVANIVRSPGSRVEGYAVLLSPEGIAKLDVFEGYPTWYIRTDVELTVVQKGTEDKTVKGVAYEMIKEDMLT